MILKHKYQEEASDDTGVIGFIVDANVQPCPFCGTVVANGKEHVRPTCPGVAYVFICPHCMAKGPTGNSEDSAIEEWNKRMVWG